MIAPHPCQRRFQNRFRAISPFRFSNWLPVAVCIHHFMVHAIDGLGGYIVETLKGEPPHDGNSTFQP